MQTSLKTRYNCCRQFSTDLINFSSKLIPSEAVLNIYCSSDKAKQVWILENSTLRWHIKEHSQLQFCMRNCRTYCCIVVGWRMKIILLCSQTFTEYPGFKFWIWWNLKYYLYQLIGAPVKCGNLIRIFSYMYFSNWNVFQYKCHSNPAFFRFDTLLPNCIRSIRRFWNHIIVLSHTST